MNLVVDVGNSLVKVTSFENLKQVAFKAFPFDEVVNAQKYVNEQMDSCDSMILASVRKEVFIKKNELPEKINFIEFSAQTPLPLKINYSTKETLGPDRLAAAVGGAAVFPGENVLVIVAGTCITYEMVTKDSEYLGGAISPGMMMRFKALNNFTGKLPLISKPEKLSSFIGSSTADCISSGVLWGIKSELEGFINDYNVTFPGIKIVFSGGDAFFFDRMLKSKIFVAENIVSYGLNKILIYNV